MRKTQTIQNELGSLSPVLERRLARLLDGGIRADAAEEIVRRIEAENASAGDRTTVDQELEEIRERQAALGRQLDQLRDMLETSREYLGLETAHFRNALSSALELLGAEPLVPMTTRNSGQVSHSSRRSILLIVRGGGRGSRSASDSSSPTSTQAPALLGRRCCRL